MRCSQCRLLAAGALVGRTGGRMAARHVAVGRRRAGMAAGAAVAASVARIGLGVPVAACRCLAGGSAAARDVAVGYRRCRLLAAGALMRWINSRVAARQVTVRRPRDVVLVQAAVVVAGMACIGRGVPMLTRRQHAFGRGRWRYRAAVVVPDSLAAGTVGEAAVTWASGGVPVGQETAFWQRFRRAAPKSEGEYCPVPAMGVGDVVDLRLRAVLERSPGSLNRLARKSLGVGQIMGLGGRCAVRRHEHQPGGKHQCRHQYRQETPSAPSFGCGHLGRYRHC